MNENLYVDDLVSMSKNMPQLRHIFRRKFHKCAFSDIVKGRLHKMPSVFTPSNRSGKACLKILSKSLFPSLVLHEFKSLIVSL